MANKDASVDMSKEPEKPPDFDNNEEDLLRFVRPNRWLSVDIRGVKLIRCNWVVSAMATAFLWSFIIYTLTDKDNALKELLSWKAWLTQNFTWLFIGTQDIWAIFLLWLLFSKYSHLKLGKDHEVPEHSNAAWFAMLFSCGVAVGLYYFGVGEPMYYYRQAGPSNWNNVVKPFFQNDDQRAQMAIFVTLFHWGLHAWVVYILVGVTLGFICYRWDMPMTMRMAFYPLIGDLVYGFLGDFIDMLSISCTTFGVCTSLGFGVQTINSGLHRLNKDIPISEEWQVSIIWVITIIATCSVCLGLKRGIKNLALFTFTLGLFMLFCILYMDNTWFLLNSIVQSFGHYFQYVIQIGFECDTFQQLNFEFQTSETTNQLWGSGTDKLVQRLADHSDPARGIDLTLSDPQEYYDGSQPGFMNAWTVFYWAWWISWAPFVGMFIARVSRGRTIREVIIGGFLAPTTFSFVFLVVLGSLGIKMQRVAELALHVQPDYEKGTFNCTLAGYVGGEPVSEAALALADVGYYAPACRSNPELIFDIMEPYGKSVALFMHVIILIGVTLYFITSSDSGSYVDDILSANGFGNPPMLQKVYWAVTEGACATALVVAGGAASLDALQAVSICAGFPYTIALCFICTSMYRALLVDQKDPSIMNKAKFNTNLFDFCDMFAPPSAPVDAPGFVPRVVSLGLAIVCPMIGIKKVATLLYNNENAGIMHAMCTGVIFYGWFILMCMDAGAKNVGYYGSIGWALLMLFFFWITFLRTKMRTTYNVYGGEMEDFFCALVMYPFVVSQLDLQVSRSPQPYLEEKNQPHTVQVGGEHE